MFKHILGSNQFLVWEKIPNVLLVIYNVVKKESRPLPEGGLAVHAKTN
ncbi:hypothetical protein C900_00990 [Fulvivirga imtechensis AK7]|uniref:Uncharacterized protein n=1 Tax=Fulvivirga imtechensis AK7 TaxID=1237149 RepID=L8JUC4_9BACT|nr:hypothetical protein C900_00990 [Fulvivirga imtechensis AK7]